MKKIIALFLVFIYSSLNTCFAFSGLYYVKNSTTQYMQDVVNRNLTNANYNVIKTNPYYAVSHDGRDYSVIILQQSGDNLFYYYQSENNEKINNSVLKELKRNNIVYEQSFNPNNINIYDSLAQGIVKNNGAVKQYTFEEEEETVFKPAQSTTSQNAYTPRPNTLQGGIAQISAGTTIPVYLQNAINTSTAQVGDNITAVLTQDLKYNNYVIAPQGSVVYGKLAKARSASYGSRSGRVVIVFNQLVTPENQVYNISCEEIDFSVSDEGRVAESAKKAVSSAVVGALVGLLFAAFSQDPNYLRGAAIGAASAGGISVATSVAAKGADAEIPSFTELELTLTAPLNVTINY